VAASLASSARPRPGMVETARKKDITAGKIVPARL
jgi:hypothetical protein